MDDKSLKDAGLKVTSPRLKILQLLEQTDNRHLSAEDIYQAFVASGDEIGIATVYRVLTQFEAAGLVIRHYFESGHSVFELDRGEHHDHLVCTKCHSVSEFVDPLIEKRQDEIATNAGFNITNHSLNIYGVCRSCQHKS
ncbi:MAG: ferric iron uptake transcriptional regulator [Gammaproteobacteria bacterium]